MTIADKLWTNEHRIEAAARELGRTAGIRPEHGDNLRESVEKGNPHLWTSALVAMLDELVEKHRQL